MIKINLLGDSTKLDYTNRYIVFGFILSFFVTGFLCYSLYDNTQNSIRSQTIKLTKLKEDLSELQKQTKVVKELESKKSELRQKLLLLAKLRRNKIGPVKVLDDLNTSLPDGIWIREMKDNDSNVRIIGRALDNQNIALFIKELSESNYFSSVDLVESRQVYYSKKTGQVSSSPDVAARGGVGNEGRVTKDKKFSYRQTAKARRGQISENNVRIKEFSVNAQVNYTGLVVAKSQEVEIEEEIQFPELKELENL